MYILVNVTATAAQPQINIFLSYSTDGINYYTDSKNIICQEFGTAGTERIKNVGFQFIKFYCDDATTSNVKIAYSVFD